MLIWGRNVLQDVHPLHDFTHCPGPCCDDCSRPIGHCFSGEEYCGDDVCRCHCGRCLRAEDPFCSADDLHRPCPIAVQEAKSMHVDDKED